MSDNTSSRSISLIMLKCICCFCVITIHAASPFLKTDVGSLNFFFAAVWSTLCRFAVPVFLMITGALLLSPDKELSIGKIFKSYFLRILICLFFWTIIYELFLIGANYIFFDNYKPGIWRSALYRVLSFNHHFHLYYLQILLLLYALLPILRAFVKNAGDELLIYALALWFVLGIIFPVLFGFELFSSVSGIPSQYPLSLLYCAPGYALLGYFLKTRSGKIRPRIFALLFLAGFLSLLLILCLASKREGELASSWLDVNTPSVCLEAAGIFGFVCSLEGQIKLRRFAVLLSSGSFCVFLVHHFFIMAFQALLPDIYSKGSFILIPLLSLACLSGSLLVYLILHKIPLFRKYLI
ncbi:MAG: acyltransferase family protein [Oscillospiraceae bacterium]|nr:acyltransferase family protein [Oscillospiraceae bacterium]